MIRQLCLVLLCCVIINASPSGMMEDNKKELSNSGIELTTFAEELPQEENINGGIEIHHLCKRDDPNCKRLPKASVSSLIG